MNEKEKNTYTSMHIFVFLVCLFYDKLIEGLLVLIIAHLIDIKYTLRNKYK